jgi:hypothetical protein
MTTTTPYRPPSGIAAPARWSVALALGLLVAAFHFFHGRAVAHTVLMQSFNWVFDFDSSRFVGGWCTAGADVARDMDISFVARHALSLATRPACLALLPLTGTPELALMALTALCMGLTAGLAYGLAAVFCAAEIDRVLLALGYALSVHPLLLGLIPETYGFALAGIGLHWLLLARGKADPLQPGAWGRVSLFLNMGFTVTNAALNGLSSAVLAWRRVGWRPWLALEARTWLIAGGALAAVLVASAALFTPELLTHLGAAPQRVWWVVNINRGEPASPLMVVVTFVLYSFVAPVMTVVQLPAPDLHPMLDFRSFQFSPAGWAALALWAVAMSLSVRLAWQDSVLRRLLVVAGVWVLMNIVLHAYWQYRGSVYLYGAHTSFALFAVLAMGYGRALQRFAVGRVRLFATLLVVFTAINNGGAYVDMFNFLRQQPLLP